jgi:hypothetical protein
MLVGQAGPTAKGRAQAESGLEKTWSCSIRRGAEDAGRGRGGGG